MNDDYSPINRNEEYSIKTTLTEYLIMGAIIAGCSIGAYFSHNRQIEKELNPKNTIEQKVEPASKEDKDKSNNDMLIPILIMQMLSPPNN